MLQPLWSCPDINKYWSRIFDLIEQVLGNHVLPSPGMALLSLDIDSIIPAMRSIVSHIFLDIRLNIVRHWKDYTPPNLTETL